MKEAKYFLLIRFSIEPHAEAKVIAWLDYGHVAEVLKQPGFLWCKRIKGTERGSYAIIYGLESKAAFLAYEGDASLKKKFMAERAQFEKHMKIDRFHGEVEFSS